MEIAETLDAAAKKDGIRKAGIINSIVLAIDRLDIALIFYMGATEALKLIFEHLARYFMLPIAAASNVIFAILAWRTAYLNDFEGHSVGKAIIETIGAIAICTAVIGAFTATAAFALAGPIIFACMFGLKTLFNAASAIYYGVKAAQTDDPVKKAEYRAKVKDSVIATIIGTLATAAVIVVLLFAKPAFAFLGIIAGAAGAAIAAMKAIELAAKPADKPKDQLLLADVADAPDNNTVMTQTLSRGKPLQRTLSAPVIMQSAKSSGKLWQAPKDKVEEPLRAHEYRF
jgi:hypothetical protein